MNSVLQEIYATILPSAPYVIAAYVLVWVALLVYVVFATTRFKNAEAQLALVQHAIEDKADRTASVLKEG